MTPCTAEPVGELGEVSRRLLALKAWWRPEQVEHVRTLLEEAAALPARQAEAAELLREAQDCMAKLEPSAPTQAAWPSKTALAAWRLGQGTVTQRRNQVLSLRAEEVALLTELEVELWWARTGKLKDGSGEKAVASF